MKNELKTSFTNYKNISKTTQNATLARLPIKMMYETHNKKNSDVHVHCVINNLKSLFFIYYKTDSLFTIT